MPLSLSCTLVAGRPLAITQNRRPLGSRQWTPCESSPHAVQPRRPTNREQGPFPLCTSRSLSPCVCSIGRQSTSCATTVYLSVWWTGSSLQRSVSACAGGEQWPAAPSPGKCKHLLQATQPSEGRLLGIRLLSASLGMPSVLT